MQAEFPNELVELKPDSFRLPFTGSLLCSWSPCGRCLCKGTTHWGLHSMQAEFPNELVELKPDSDSQSLITGCCMQAKFGFPNEYKQLSWWNWAGFQLPSVGVGCRLSFPNVYKQCSWWSWAGFQLP